MPSDIQETLLLGATLAKIRDNAKITQVALAKKLPMSAPTISRIESGDIALSYEEIRDYLKIIGTPEADNCSLFYQQTWREIPAPPFHHPDREYLWTAESLLQQLKGLKSPDTKVAFVRQVEFYEKEILHISDYLRDLFHQFAFIGSIGVGKSTAICLLTGLSLSEEKKFANRMVLEIGGGGTTICEIVIKHGPQFGIIVEPRSEENIRQDVADFSEFLMTRAGREDNSHTPREAEGNIGISREIERAIRNMAGLAVITQRTSDGKRIKRDPANDLVVKCSNTNDLVIEIMSRMKLPNRQERTIWFSSETNDSPMKCLQRDFTAINNGRHPNFAIPDRMEVVVPFQPLSVPDPHYSPYEIQIVDTRGVNQTTQRADLECHFDDDRTITILCSKFMDAPEQAIQSLLERVQAAGVKSITDRTVILVLPRPTEAEAMKDDAGNSVDENEGYEIKQDQIALALGRLGLSEIPICFFNAMYEDCEESRKMLMSCLQKHRELYRKRLRELSGRVQRLAENKEREEVQAVLNESARRITTWLSKNRDIGDIRENVQEALLQAIRTAHPRSIWASTRRNGNWHNLNYYYQLGYGARIITARHIKNKIDDFNVIVQNLIDDPQLAPAHDFLNELQTRIGNMAGGLLQRLQIAGTSTFEEELREDSEFWRKCEERWGLGSGYRNNIADKSNRWFEDAARKKQLELIVRLIRDGWESLASEIAELVEQVISDEDNS